MEWLAGQTLAVRLGERPICYRDAAIILLQICDALDAAHAVGIVHRDLKPENVFLVPVRGGRTMVKLLDFGLAKLAGDEEKGIHRTQAGTAMGTPAYMSPEQARATHVDHRTDIYALGIMMFELFVGHLPFQAEATVDLVHQQVYEAPPDIRLLAPLLPEPVADGVMRMLSKDAAGRPSLATMREVLLLLCDESTATSAPQWQLRDSGQMTGPLPVDKPAIRRRQRGLVLAAALLPLATLIAVKTWPSAHATDRAPPLAMVAPPIAAPPLPPLPPPPVIPTLVLYLDTRGVIMLDGRVVASGTEAHIPVDEPGAHELTVTARDRAPLKQSIWLRPGQTLELSLSLPPLPSARSKPRPQRSKVADVDYMVDPFAGRN